MCSNPTCTLVVLPALPSGVPGTPRGMPLKFKVAYILGGHFLVSGQFLLGGRFVVCGQFSTIKTARVGG